MVAGTQILRMFGTRIHRSKWMQLIFQIHHIVFVRIFITKMVQHMFIRDQIARRHGCFKVTCL